MLPSSKEDVVEIGKDLGYDGLPIRNDDYYLLSRGVESKKDPGGYSGRAGLYETIVVDEDIQKTIINHSTANEIMRLAKEKGTITIIYQVVGGTTMKDRPLGRKTGPDGRPDIISFFCRSISRW